MAYTSIFQDKKPAPFTDIEMSVHQGLVTTSRKTSQSGMKLDNLTHLLHLTIRLQAQKSDLVNIPKAVPSPRHGSIVTKLTVTSNAEINLQE